MDARRKFEEHERCVSPRATLASWVLSKLPKCIHNSIYAQLKEIYYIAAKIACFLINCKILVARNTEKQTLLLAGYKHATIVDFERKFFL